MAKNKENSQINETNMVELDTLKVGDIVYHRLKLDKMIVESIDKEKKTVTCWYENYDTVVVKEVFASVLLTQDEFK